MGIIQHQKSSSAPANKQDCAPAYAYHLSSIFLTSQYMNCYTMTGPITQSAHGRIEVRKMGL